MHDGVDAVEKSRRQVAYVAEVLRVEAPLGKCAAARQAVREEAGVEADERRLGVRGAQALDHRRADVAQVSGDQDRRRPVRPRHQTLQGGSPDAQSASRTVLVAERVHALPVAPVLGRPPSCPSAARRSSGSCSQTVESSAM